MFSAILINAIDVSKVARITIKAKKAPGTRRRRLKVSVMNAVAVARAIVANEAITAIPYRKPAIEGEMKKSKLVSNSPRKNFLTCPRFLVNLLTCLRG